MIFETRTIGISEKPANIDDIIETSNHFRCIDHIIDSARKKLTQAYIISNIFYRGLSEWDCEPGYLIDIALTAQDHFKSILDSFQIDHS